MASPCNNILHRLALILLLFPSSLVVVSGSEDTDTNFVSHEGKREVIVLRTTSLFHSHSLAATAPLLDLNETEILQQHGPEPLSYWAHDFDEENRQWRALMGLHVVGMGFSFFCLLPVGIVLRTAQNPWHGVTVVSFGVVAFLSAAAGSLYKKLTGDLYAGAVHGSHGFLVLALFFVLACWDALALFRRAALFLKCREKNIRLFWQSVIMNQQDRTLSGYVGLRHEDPVEHVEARSTTPPAGRPNPPPRAEPGKHVTTSHSNVWGAMENDPCDMFETVSEKDLYELPAVSPPVENALDAQDSMQLELREIRPDTGPRSWLAVVGRAVLATAERSLLLLGLMQTMSGAAVYTGICRQNWLTVCIGHMVEGGVVFCYGLFSFARYLGLWSNLGWAWNRLPARHARNMLSAEAVESMFFMFYGIMITLTERVGKKPSPLTTAKLQHLSIAVMLWIAGMLGFAFESKTLRWWISLPARACATPGTRIMEPPSYVGSFNPFPAIVAGVIGVSFYYHPQKHLFAINLHTLWGHLLVGFAVLRCLTYFFLWLRPPHSVLPSRPPTEALASFSLTCGGILFVLSADQIYFAAMRRGHDDVMLFFSFAVAVTYLAFFWVLSVITFKGWIASRSEIRSFLR